MITNSQIIEDSPQIDGRRFITELHVDDSGNEYRVTYMAEAKDNVEDNLSIRARIIEEEIAYKSSLPPEEIYYPESKVLAAFEELKIYLPDSYTTETLLDSLKTL